MTQQISEDLQARVQEQGERIVRLESGLQEIVGRMDRMERLFEAFQQEVRAEFRGLRETIEAEHRSTRETMEAGHRSIRETMEAGRRSIRETMEAEHRSIRDDLGSFKNTMFGVVFLAWVTVMTAIVVSNFL